MFPSLKRRVDRGKMFLCARIECVGIFLLCGVFFLYLLGFIFDTEDCIFVI